MPTLDQVLQQVINRLTTVERRLTRMEKPRNSTKYKGQKSGSNFTTSELPHHGDYGARLDTSELQFNVNGNVLTFAVSPGGGTGMVYHELAGSWHYGTLADSQAPQFLKLDGSRAMTGNLVTAYLVDGLDVSHHNHGSAGGAQISHGSLSGLQNNDHPQYINRGTAEFIPAHWVFERSIRLGDGTAKDIDLVFYDGVPRVLRWDDAAHAFAFTEAVWFFHYLDMPHYTTTPSHRGGRLWWDMVEGVLSTYGATDTVLHLGTEVVVRCYNDSGTTLTRGMAVRVLGGTSDFRPRVARAQANSGVNAGAIGLVASASSASGNVDVMVRGVLRNVNTESWNEGQILYLSPSTLGGITNVPAMQLGPVVRVGYVLRKHSTSGSIFVDPLPKLDVLDRWGVVFGSYQNQPINDADFFFVTPGTSATLHGDFYLHGALVFPDGGTVTTSSGALTLSAATQVQVNTVLQSSGWNAGVSGWGITPTGAADLQTLDARLVRARGFTAEVAQLLPGRFVVPATRATLRESFAIPATGGAARMYLHAPETVAQGEWLFGYGDSVLLTVVDRSEDDLVTYQIWGTVTTPIGGWGYQSWLFTTTSPGISTGRTVPAGALVLGYGQLAENTRTVWEVTALDGASGPYSQVQTWSTLTDGAPAGFATWTRMGHLAGLTGSAGEAGLYAGTGTTVNSAYAILSNARQVLHNITLETYAATTRAFYLDPGVPYLAMGHPAPGSMTGGIGWWAGNVGGVYQWRVGDPGGERVVWNGSTLTLTGGVYAHRGTVGGWTVAAQALYAGTGAPGDHFSGVALAATGLSYGGYSWSLAGVADDIVQAGFRSDNGKFMAAGGAVALDVNGLTLAVGEAQANQVKWAQDALTRGALYTYVGTVGEVSRSTLAISVPGGSTRRGEIALWAGTGDSAARLFMGGSGGYTHGQIQTFGNWTFEDDATVDADLLVTGTCSATTFVDLTPAFKGDALAVLRGVRGQRGKLDHTSLPAFAQATLYRRVRAPEQRSGWRTVAEPGRDLGAMVTLLTAALQQLEARLAQLEEKG